MSDPSLYRSSEIGMTHCNQNGNRQKKVRHQFERIDVDVTQVTSVESRSLSLASNDSLERSNFLGSLLKFFK